MATILIVDDVAANRALLGTVLRHYGHGVVEAPNGERALYAARTERPDLVVTDVLMPVMDGYELVRQLRLDPGTRDIPVVFHTAHYAEREARELALASGVAWVLNKPAAPAVVVDIIERALAGQSEKALDTAAPPAETFDQEHLRLMTDKLSEKNGNLRGLNARMRALINIGLDIASESDVGKLLEKVCIAARDLFGATYVTLGVVERSVVRRAVSYGADTSGVLADAQWIQGGDRVPGVLAEAIDSRRTLLGDNPERDPTALHLPSAHPPIRSYLVAPVASPTQVYGWICLVRNEERFFTDDDRQLATALAGQVGRVYEASERNAANLAHCRDMERELMACREAMARLRAERDTAQMKLTQRR